MNEKLRKAIANNNDLYRAIFEQYQIESNSHGFIWYCLEETPPLYSNLVTTSKDWKPDKIFYQIDNIYEKEKWSEWSIKDSFDVLNLVDFGFDKLFEANWFYLQSNKFSPLSTSRNLRYEIIENEKDLARWKIAWDEDAQLGDKIFTSRLLLNSGVFFVAGFAGERIVSGCFVNETEDVFGLSNFFAPDDGLAYRSDLIEFVYKSTERRDIVGYEKNFSANRLEQIGFETIGNLTIWLKKNNTLK